MKKCVPGLPMTNGHGDARHPWRAGLRPAGKAAALNYMEQFSQASNNKHPNRVSGWGVFFSGYVGMTYSLRVAERRPGHRQASNIKAPIRNSWGFLLCAIKKCVPGLPMTNGHGDARHPWRAGLRPVGRADALNYMEQFSQASNIKAPIRNGWGFLLCAIKKCVPDLPVTYGHGDAR
ncbi:hypothetical protein [Teredinibacter turnerae]|uniref:hypothetical protein n=1 Tax=Teredinibacter turnerae TaxID=2426 RepID=UPI0005A218B6|nr:hypothetical protein [Teredinibacter turnerae]